MNTEEKKTINVKDSIDYLSIVDSSEPLSHQKPSQCCFWRDGY